MAQDYAFGDTTMRGRECPAKAAGLSPETGGVEANMAEKYDEMARELTQLDEGILPGGVAERMWSDALDCLREERRQKVQALVHPVGIVDDSDIDHLDDVIEVGEEVQRELFE